MIGKARYRRCRCQVKYFNSPRHQSQNAMDIAREIADHLSIMAQGGAPGGVVAMVGHGIGQFHAHSAGACLPLFDPAGCLGQKLAVRLKMLDDL